MSAQPVSYRDSLGRWRPIENQLVADGADAYRNAANRFSAVLPAGIDGSPDSAIRFEDDDASVEFSLEGAKAAGMIRGAEAVYREALPGVDVAYEVTAMALRETLTLTRPGAQDRFAYRIEPGQGLTPRLQGDGSVIFTDSAGHTRLSFSATTMTSERVDVPRPVEASLDRDGDAFVLQILPDRRWVQRELAAGYRVVIDPDVYPDAVPGQDCTISSATPTVGDCLIDHVGWDGTGDHRALVLFDVQDAVPRGVQVLEARLGAEITSTSTRTAKQIGLYQLQKPWSGQVSWQTTDGATAWAAAGGDVVAPPAATASAGTVTGRVNFFPTALAQGWADGTQPNYGLMLRDVAPNTVANKLVVDRTRSEFEITWRPRLGAPAAASIVDQELNDRSAVGVNVANGNLLLKNQDVQIFGTGLGVAVDRYFNSLDTERHSLETGWTLTEGPDTQLFADAAGQSVYLSGPGGRLEAFQRLTATTFNGPPELGATLTQPSASRWTLTYDATGITQTFTGGAAGCPAYLTSQQDRYGNTITYAYNNTNCSGGGLLLSVTDSQGRVLAATRDLLDRITRLTDATGRVWTYHYSGDELDTYTDPEGEVTAYGYDAYGVVNQITTPGGRVTRIQYVDAANGDHRVRSILRVTNSGAGTGDTTSFSYRATPIAPCSATDFRQTVVTDPRGNRSTYCFDPKDRAVSVFDAQGHRKPATFDANGNRLSFQRSGASAVTRARYDASNRLVSATDATGVQTTFAYSATSGRPYAPNQAVGGSGATRNYCYASGSGFTGCPSGSGQPAGALTGVLDASNNPLLTFNYNRNGTISSAQDALGTTTLSYDGRGNLTTVQPPSPRASMTYTPDALSRVARSTDGNGNTTTYAYDHLDRLTRATFQGGSTMTYTYDDDGNVTRRVDSAGSAPNGTGTTDYVYDLKNRLTRETLPGGAINVYGYDGADNLTSLTDSTGTATYGYDSINQLTSLAEPGGTCSGGSPTLCSTFGYDAYGNRTSTTLANGNTIASTWDAAGRMLTTQARRGATVLTSYTYTYRGGLRGTVTDKDANTTTYTYDVKDRLTRARTLDRASVTVDDYQYTYDVNGNRTSQSHNGTFTYYGYNAANQLCWRAVGSVGTCAVPPAGAVTYTYDRAGQQTGNSAGFALSYNDRGQTSGGYNPRGGAANTQAFGGLGQSEITRMGPLNYQNNMLGQGIQRGGLYGDVNIVREPDGTLFSQTEARRRHYFLFDALGSVTALANTDGINGGLGGYFTYEPFGVPITTTRNAENYFWFVGSLEPFDYTALSHFGERFYADSQARWTQPDPVAHPTDPGQYNPYAYVAGNPVNFVDPTGESLISDAVDGLKQTIKAIDRPNQLKQAWECGTELGRNGDLGRCDPTELFLGEDVDPAY